MQRYERNFSLSVVVEVLLLLLLLLLFKLLLVQFTYSTLAF